jgi:hypothetical protein
LQLGTATRGGWVAVASGLSAGDQLIAEPADLREGQKVRVEAEAALPANDAPAMAPAAAPAKKEAGHGVH